MLQLTFMVEKATFRLEGVHLRHCPASQLPSILGTRYVGVPRSRYTIGATRHQRLLRGVVQQPFIVFDVSIMSLAAYSYPSTYLLAVAIDH